jgi:hypothetical protein
MAITLTSDVAATLAAKTTYAKAAWTTVVDDFATSDAPAIGGIEKDFPGVKPAHVAHMLRQDLKARKPLLKVAVSVDKKYGICLVRQS